jgi:hypothetical protein
MPKIAQSYDVNRFQKNVFLFLADLQKRFFMLNIFMFLSPTCAHFLVIPKCTSFELIMIFGLTKIIILDLCMFSFVN